MTPRLTASQLYSHLTCPHRVAMDAVGDPAHRDPASPFVQMLWERGIAHERELVTGRGMPVLDLSGLRGDEKEAATREAVARAEPLIYAGRLSVHDLVGEPDLLRREGKGYVAVDIKSGAGREGADDASEGKLKVPYGVQLALYTDILERMGLSAGRHGYILDGQGIEVRYNLDQRLGARSPCLWEIYLRTRQAVRETLQHPRQSRPALAAACKQCVWRSACLDMLRRAQDLTLLPELGRAARDALCTEFPALPDLAGADLSRYIDGERTDFPRVGASALRRFQRRARLALDPDAVPYLTRAIDLPVAPVELFFDIETDPLRQRCYLHGFVVREQQPAGGWREHFEGIFATGIDDAAEREAFAQAMQVFRRHPQARVIHYSAYERTEYRRLAARYPQVATADEVEALFARPRALDLYLDIIRPGSEWPTTDFSIKSLAKHCGFAWRDADPSGASSIEWFDQWVRTGDGRLRQRLLDYNEDDCLAMRVVWDMARTLPVRV